MTIKDFLSSLNTLNIKVTIKDSYNELICKIYADSVSAINTELADKVVDSWSIISANSIKIMLEPEEDEEEEEPSEDETPNENGENNTELNPNENPNPEDNTET